MKAFYLAPGIADYLDICEAERPAHDGDLFSLRHPHMPLSKRAKLFMPFDALRGFDFAISTAAAEAEYVPMHSLGEDEAQALDAALRRLRELTANGGLTRANRPMATVTYFAPCADPGSPACGELGCYLTRTGVVELVDPVRKVIVVDGTEVGFPRIASISLPER